MNHPKKYTKIGLMLFVTVVLLLALDVPGLAKQEPAEDCRPLFPSTTISNIDNLNLRLYGELKFVGWEDGKLINICEGEVPFGEPMSPGLTWFEYEDLEDFGRWDWSSKVATFTCAEGENIYTAQIYDTDGSMYWTTSGVFEIYPHGGSQGFGRFILYKYYNPDVE
jgi:hypothetical protein